MMHTIICQRQFCFIIKNMWEQLKIKYSKGKNRSVRKKSRLRMHGCDDWDYDLYAPNTQGV